MSDVYCEAGTNLIPHHCSWEISLVSHTKGLVFMHCVVSVAIFQATSIGQNETCFHTQVFTPETSLTGECSVADSHGFTLNLGARAVFSNSLYPESCDYPSTFSAFIIFYFNLHECRIKLKNMAMCFWEGQRANNFSEFHLNENKDLMFLTLSECLEASFLRLENL